MSLKWIFQLYIKYRLDLDLFIPRKDSFILSFFLSRPQKGSSLQLFYLQKGFLRHDKMIYCGDSLVRNVHFSQIYEHDMKFTVNFLTYNFLPYNHSFPVVQSLEFFLNTFKQS
jgi:hypothetical protein